MANATHSTRSSVSNGSGTSVLSTLKKHIEEKDSGGAKRITLKLSAEIAELLDTLCELRDMTRTQAIKQAITTEAYLQAKIRQGAVLTIREPNGREVELLMR